MIPGPVQPRPVRWFRDFWLPLIVVGLSILAAFAFSQKPPRIPCGTDQDCAERNVPRWPEPRWPVP